jgi:hypothetical protein
MSTNRGPTFLDNIILLLIAGVPAAIMVPRCTETPGNPHPPANPRCQLQTIRGQIELYNVHNPAAPYDAMTDLATFWEPLLQDDYLLSAPGNWMQDNSSLVVGTPRAGAGWVWAEWPPSVPALAGQLTIFAIDEDGTLLSDPDTGNPY